MIVAALVLMGVGIYLLNERDDGEPAPSEVERVAPRDGMLGPGNHPPPP
jgi:hypothetical protein